MLHSLANDVFEKYFAMQCTSDDIELFISHNWVYNAQKICSMYMVGKYNILLIMSDYSVVSVSNHTIITRH